tara:strand:- start:21 stop:500 length:480 start_codon:yes stop_codon:yes gene_type:complete
MPDNGTNGVNLLRDLPDELRDLIVYHVISWNSGGHHYDELLRLIQIQVKDLENIRLVHRGTACSYKIRKYFYYATWMAWSAQGALDLLKEPGTATLEVRQGRAHVAWFKDVEVWRMVNQTNDAGDIAPFKRLLRYTKARRAELENLMRVQGLLPDAAQP